MAEIKSATQSTSPQSVLAKTGRPQDEWFRVLDAFDVKSNGHKAAADHLYKEHGASYWWAQQLTILYEQAHGLRQPGQRHQGGFAVNVSKTINATVEEAFAAWSSPVGWNSWFTSGATVDFVVGGRYADADGDSGTFLKIVPPGPPNRQGEAARIELSWEHAEHCPGSRVTVQFMRKSDAKVQVALTHDKIADEDGCRDMKGGWSWAMASLKSWLETGRGLSESEWKAAQKG